MSKAVEFTDVRCPQCNEVVLSHTKIDYLYGSPVRECPFCKAEVIDPYYHEIAIDGYRKDPRVTRKLIKDIIIAGAFIIISAFLNLISFALNSGSVIMVMLMLFAVFLLITRIVTFFTDRKKMGQTLAKQTKESEERMMDKAYASKLAGLGYKVPEKYL